MARRSLTEREKRRAELADRYADRRATLKTAISAPSTDPEERAAAVRALAALPRDSSRSRQRSRDQIDGRPRGVLSRFGLSRVRFRELALRGELPGVRKASW
ncbi:putative ribosomal protein S14 [Actinoplanes missouriensis 431]|uniref:Small ribosomal subunit protein uS14 n=1 Tax=Actinoplanes missouriensis (strain ATCC 14538 / DSM 43046 / CBS 188.64 / JCM 3121 / NBRC 102363 / NCIMB 12654 / NRRL B-3342 / UNCC 431) TaxID=512565 RepID=I0H4V8_ACTM4|nr:30S ribosomal protein S14 [Actinoplanes missouriensis]BAL88045.1 putative ribosomal protein S14 [Actinoplanes missouriensis 431]